MMTHHGQHWVVGLGKKKGFTPPLILIIIITLGLLPGQQVDAASS
jgi:hypothetical protein